MYPQQFEHVSHFYNYVCPPPYGSGSHTKLVVETVQRSTEYARKNPHPENTEHYNGVPILSQCQTKGRPIVTLEPQGFFHKECAMNMITDFCERYKNYIGEAIGETIQWAHETSISEIGKGRQTLEVVSENTIKASAALERFCQFLKLNDMSTDYTLITFCESVWSLFDKPYIKIQRDKWKRVPKTSKYKKKVYSKGRDFVYEREKIEEIVEGTKKDELLFEMLSQFETFRKDAERNKSKRRAIASPGIPLRCFFRIVEEFGKKLCKRIPESTISVGGDEKKNKLQHMLNEVMNQSVNYPYRLIITGDNQKWNECMSSELFIRGLRSMCFLFNDLHDVEKDGSWYGRQLIWKIFQTTFTVLFHKRVRCGSGKRVSSKQRKLFKYLKLSEIVGLLKEIPEEEERESYQSIADLIYKDNTLINSPGMLMGMLNILSTFIGLIGMTYNNDGRWDPIYREMFFNGKLDKNMIRSDLSKKVEIPLGEEFLTKPLARTFCVQSSDDFFLIAIGVTEEIVTEKVKETFANCKVLGVNWSPAKTIVREMRTSGVGEYTSWFVNENRLVPQWGSDTAQLRPGGINCQSDLSSGTRAILDKIQTRNMNYIGAETALRLLARSLRILYYIEYGQTPMGLRPDLVCLANGGTFKFTPSKLHLDETAILLETHESWEEDKKNTVEWANFDAYIRRLINPECPLNTSIKEISEFDPDTMETKTFEQGVIMNANNVQLRSNRKITNKKLDENLRREVYSLVEKMSILIRPTLSAIPSTSKVSLYESLEEKIQSWITLFGTKKDLTPIETEVLNMSRILSEKLKSLQS